MNEDNKGQDNIFNGTVEWYDVDNKFGVISYDNDSSVYVNMEDIAMKDGVRELHKGDCVKFTLKEDKNYIRAIDVIVLDDEDLVGDDSGKENGVLEKKVCDCSCRSELNALRKKVAELFSYVGRIYEERTDDPVELETALSMFDSAKELDPKNEKYRNEAEEVSRDIEYFRGGK